MLKHTVEIVRDLNGKIQDAYALDPDGDRVARLPLTSVTFEYPADELGRATLHLMAGHVTTTEQNYG